MPSFPIYNVHRRSLPASADDVGALLETLGRSDDGIWPAHDWMPLRLDGPMELGTMGGHGPARYRIVSHQPRRLVRFRFHEPSFMAGFHEFSVEPDGHGRTVIQHVLALRLGILGWPVFPIAFLSVHNEVIEQALDRVEQTITGSVAHPVRPTLRNKARTAVLSRYFQRIGAGARPTSNRMEVGHR